jgi:hypothetical protein
MELGAIPMPSSAEEWSAFGTVLLGLGAVTAGFWTLFNYRKSRRAEAAHWLRDVFSDLYVGDRFSAIKRALEYEYQEKLGPLLERRVKNDRDKTNVAPAKDEIALLDQLDMLLNYFEFVIYLERERHLERHAVFDYWFGLMEKDDRSALREYIGRFKFTRVGDTLDARESSGTTPA